MPWARADDGCEIYYDVRGDGPTVVFVSGFKGITGIWREQVQRLESQYRCITFDNRGYGRSDKPLPGVAYGIDRHASDLTSVLEVCGVPDGFVLMGHSMGGNVISTFAANEPSRVAGLVYLGSFVSGSQLAEIGLAAEVLQDAVAEPSGRLEFFTSLGSPEDLAEESAKWPLYAILGNVATVLRSDTENLLSSLHARALVVQGLQDAATPFEPCGVAMAAALPSAQLAKIERAGHFPMLECPAQVNSLLEEFLMTCAV